MPTTSAAAWQKDLGFMTHITNINCSWLKVDCFIVGQVLVKTTAFFGLVISHAFC